MRERVPHPATPRELLRVLRIPRDERVAFKRNLRNLVNDGSLIEIDPLGRLVSRALVVAIKRFHGSDYGRTKWLS